MLPLRVLLFLAILQGITEFLPISSSGHLAISQLLIPSFQEPALVFDLFLHLGTLIATFIYFRKEILDLFRTLFSHIGNPQKLFWFHSDSKNYIPALFWGTLITGLIAFPIKDIAENAFTNFHCIIGAFVITSVLLFITRYAKESAHKTIGIKEALLIGIFQAIAIFPGISRSGATIAIALLLGLQKKEAFTLSFLLSIPAISGSLIIECFNMRDILLAKNIMHYLSGSFVAFIVGYPSLILLSKIIQRAKFYYFSYYCFALAIVIIFYLYTTT
ncbi:MAG: hypothetical protein A2Y62_05140 [Candidatus Fischerbacteria bacterium RBG_13_37_8]|uniref:Undecaprenyl-diphosphatase n=1 Tax=Candidatus Fischerbacteria bacterium RBG_13_37_8 TaxID=1817863 RepID=A0A1F5V8P7_9BACT|nr:MAG: hypothetical protein A2Y62_05140 [Candidatus Fischerbacteria bacterium RBG_13_37_8]